MALLFTDSTTNKVSFSAPFTMGSGQEFTFLELFYRTANTGGGGTSWYNAAGTGAGIDLQVNDFTAGQIFSEVPRATTNSNAVIGSADAPPLNTWMWVATIYSEATDVYILSAPLGGTFTVLPRIAFQTGAGATNTIDGTLYYDNRGATNTNARGGRCGAIGLWNVRLSVAQLNQVIGAYPKPFLDPKLWVVPWDVAAVQDLSGNKKNGTLTGATTIAQPPLTARFGLGAARAVSASAGGGGGVLTAAKVRYRRSQLLLPD